MLAVLDRVRCRGMLDILVLASCCFLAGTAVAQEPSPVAPKKPSDATRSLEIVAAFEDVLADAIERSEKSVVAISRVRRDDVRARAIPNAIPPLREENIESPLRPGFVPNEFATGVVVGPRLILTCHHVLRDGSDYYIHTYDRKQYKAKVIANDPRFDMAVLEIELKDLSLAPIAFGDAEKIRKGQFCVVLGNPYAIARDGRVCASFGIVSNLERAAVPQGEDRGKESRPTLHHFGTLIHTDARLNLGTSGGAMLNIRGEMIGLVTAKAAVVGFEEGAGFAIPANATFRRVLERLKQGKEAEFGLLGIVPEELGYVDRVINKKHGIEVARVYPGLPASSALLQRDVVSAVDGKPVYGVDDFMLRIGERAPGSVVRLEVERSGLNGAARQLNLNVELAKSAVYGRKYAEVGPTKWRGLVVEYSSAVLESARQFNTLPQEPSVAILSVDEGSPAWKAGLRPGSFITHVGKTPVAKPPDFYALVEKSAGPVTVRVVGSAEEPQTRTINPQ